MINSDVFSFNKYQLYYNNKRKFTSYQNKMCSNNISGGYKLGVYGSVPRHTRTLYLLMFCFMGYSSVRTSCQFLEISNRELEAHGSRHALVRGHFPHVELDVLMWPYWISVVNYGPLFGSPWLCPLV